MTQPSDTGPDTGPGADGETPRRRASELIEDFVAHDHGESIALGDLARLLGDRAFGMLLLLLTLPNVIPMPGLSTVTGVPMILLGLQLAAGGRVPWLPRRLAAVTIDREALLSALHKVRPRIAGIERHMRPRMGWMTRGPVERLVGAWVSVLAAVLSLPIVFGNLPPALSIAVISLGLIEKDGLLVAIGCAGGLLAIGLVAALVLGLGEAASFLIAHLMGG